MEHILNVIFEFDADRYMVGIDICNLLYLSWQIRIVVSEHMRRIIPKRFPHMLSRMINRISDPKHFSIPHLVRWGCVQNIQLSEDFYHDGVEDTCLLPRSDTTARLYRSDFVALKIYGAEHPGLIYVQTYFSHLRRLSLHQCTISDFSVLSGMTALEKLDWVGSALRLPPMFRLKDLMLNIVPSGVISEIDIGGITRIQNMSTNSNIRLIGNGSCMEVLISEKSGFADGSVSLESMERLYLLKLDLAEYYTAYRPDVIGGVYQVVEHTLPLGLRVLHLGEYFGRSTFAGGCSFKLRPWFRSSISIPSLNTLVVLELVNSSLFVEIQKVHDFPNLNILRCSEMTSNILMIPPNLEILWAGILRKQYVLGTSATVKVLHVHPGCLVQPFVSTPLNLSMWASLQTLHVISSSTGQCDTLYATLVIPSSLKHIVVKCPDDRPPLFTMAGVEDIIFCK
jgi:hypothetical protein